MELWRDVKILVKGTAAAHLAALPEPRLSRPPRGRAWGSSLSLEAQGPPWAFKKALRLSWNLPSRMALRISAVTWAIRCRLWMVSSL